MFLSASVTAAVLATVSIACVAADNSKDDRQFILVNRAPGLGMNQSVPGTINRASFEDVLTALPNSPDSRVQTGVSFVFSCFRTTPETTVAALKNFLHAAEETSTPIVVQLDFENWWEARPDLWNWWNTNAPGFNPENRNSVEWTGWSPESAIKIAWRDWGRQLRVLPPPNFESPKYIEACREEIHRLAPVVMDWYQHLPEAGKHIFVGIKVGHESSIGINAYYYPNGNSLSGEAPAEDTKFPLKSDDVTARGVAQIGYAALTFSGIRTNGVIMERDLEEVVQRHVERLCREAAQCGVPRDKLFTHGVGLHDGELLYDAAVNEYSCPGWSFYRHADDPRNDIGVARNLNRSNAPYWAAAEWFLQKPITTENWRAALTNTLADRRCRYVCIFNWESIRKSEEVRAAIRQLVEAGRNR